MYQLCNPYQILTHQTHISRVHRQTSTKTLARQPHILNKYSNSYDITLTQSPTTNQPDGNTQDTQATTSNTNMDDAHTPTDPPTHTDQPHAPPTDTN